VTLRPAQVLLLAIAAGCAGCSQLVRYTDDLVDARSGRSLFTRTPATAGGAVGLVAGLPVDLVALPVTYAVYASQDPLKRDALSTFLFPSFVLQHVGQLIGAPFDVIEWGAYRAWQDPETLTKEEVERREAELDVVDYSVFPVTPVYGRPSGG
jgi:hypothetical protein